MGVREAAVERYLHERITHLGGTTYKWVSPGHAFVLDRIVILDGIVYFVEVKTVDGVVSPGQRREIERLKALGANTSIVYGRGAVDTFVNGLQQLAAEKKMEKGVSFL